MSSQLGWVETGRVTHSGGVERLAEEGWEKTENRAATLPWLNNCLPKWQKPHSWWWWREADGSCSDGYGRRSCEKPKQGESLKSYRLRRRSFTLELHSDLNQIRWISTVSCNTGSNSSKKSLKTPCQFQKKKTKNWRICLFLL